MAITIISQPSAKVNPVFNPMYFEVSSNNINQSNFNYVFQLFTGSSISGPPISTVNLLPRPNTALALYNPSRILQSYLGYDLGYQNITGLTLSNNAMLEYIIDYGESYGPLSAITVYSGLQDTTSYAFNGVLQYASYPSWSTTYNSSYYNGSPPSSVTALKFLTNQPRSGVLVKESTDRGCVSVFTPYFSNSFYSGFGWSVTVTHSDYTTSTHQFNEIPTNVNNIMYIPSGPWNINNAGAGTLINLSSDLSYTVAGLVKASALSIASAFTENLTYLIDQSCNKYTPVRIMFMNSLGGWDFFNFVLVNVTTINMSSRGTYQKVLPFNYQIGARQTTVIDMNGTYNYQVTSDWINDATSKWLGEMVSSPEIYMIDSSGNAYPVQMVENSYVIQTAINNHLYNVTFNFTSSYQINSQHN